MSCLARFWNVSGIALGWMLIAGAVATRAAPAAVVGHVAQRNDCGCTDDPPFVRDPVTGTPAAAERDA